MCIQVVHCANEISIKNYSISQIVNSFLEKFNNKKIKTRILTIKKDNYFKKIIKKTFFSSFIEFLLLEGNKLNIIHIHGIWGFFQIFILVFLRFKNFKVIIHCHGMLLLEAMKSKGTYSYYKKILFLKIFKILIRNSYLFTTATHQEKNRIKFFFPDSRIIQSYNFVEIFPKKLFKNNFKKNFIFMGRINSHKNVDVIIKSFLKANLNNEWKLFIYGIEDNLSYQNKIKKIVKKKKNIYFLGPVFGENKKKVLETAWCNIVFSNSEIISLSFVESCMSGLPTILSKKIYLNKIKYPKQFICNHNIEELKKKIIYVSRMSKKKRIKLKLNLINIFSKYFDNNNILQIYKKIYNS